MSWHQFAELVFSVAKEGYLIEKSPVVKPIPSSEYPTKAKRPAYSVLDSQSFQQKFGVVPANVRESLAVVTERIAETAGDPN